MVMAYVSDSWACAMIESPASGHVRSRCVARTDLTEGGVMPVPTGTAGANSSHQREREIHPGKTPRLGRSVPLTACQPLLKIPGRGQYSPGVRAADGMELGA